MNSNLKQKLSNMADQDEEGIKLDAEKKSDVMRLSKQMSEALYAYFSVGI